MKQRYTNTLVPPSLHTRKCKLTFLNHLIFGQINTSGIGNRWHKLLGYVDALNICYAVICITVIYFVQNIANRYFGGFMLIIVNQYFTSQLQILQPALIALLVGKHGIVDSHIFPLDVDGREIYFYVAHFFK